MLTTLFRDLDIDGFSGCCGVSVTHEFPNMVDIDNMGGGIAEREEILSDMKEYFGKPRDHLCLISLIDDQLHDGWLSIVQDAGFKRLARFSNGGGNIVNLFGHAKTKGIPAYKGKKKKT